MHNIEQITLQGLADGFKRLEKSFVELKAEIKEKLKELQQEEVDNGDLDDLHELILCV